MASRSTQAGEDRRDKILRIARERAEGGGWAAVTTRALAAAIGYTQPVLYGHFPGGKADIMSAVAVIGFGEMATELRAAARGLVGRERLRATAMTYLDFAAANPAVYEAMFSLPISAEFGTGTATAELRDAFGTLQTAVDGDDESDAELLWAALHGVSLLEASGRLRAGARGERLDRLAQRFGPQPSTGTTIGSNPAART